MPFFLEIIPIIRSVSRKAGRWGLVLIPLLFSSPAMLCAQDSILAFTNAKIYLDPFKTPIERGSVIIAGSKIIGIGESGKISIPQNAKQVSLAGKCILAGFWNSHIHLMEPHWLSTDSLSGEQLSSQFQKLLTSYGFTHAVDLAALDIGNLTRLRKRIENGNVEGPALLLAGVPFAPPAASPFYIAPYRLPELDSKKAVKKHIKEQFSKGADLIKIWSASPTGTAIINMPPELVMTAAKLTRQRNRILAAHPTNLEGAEIAVNHGVNLLVHSAPEDRNPWPEDLIVKMVQKRVGLIPTLKLYKWDLESHGIITENHSLIETAVTQLKQYHQQGGIILFGTDLGYMTDYNPLDEWLLMQKAGLSYLDILASMTTTPAEFFGLGDKVGRVETGFTANLVVLSEDPAVSINAFSSIFYTIQNGRIIYESIR